MDDQSIDRQIELEVKEEGESSGEEGWRKRETQIVREGGGQM